MLKRFLACTTVVCAVIGGLAAQPGAALLDDEPEAIPWTDLLPGFSAGYDPSSEHDCKKGHIKCVDSVIREMDRRFQPLAQACAHNAMFSLMYLRTTERYRDAATTAGFFEDPSFVNHQDVVFADHYFRAWDDHYKGRVVSESWRLAFTAADDKRVTGTGNMLLGMSAHVNRDLPITLESIGMTKPDGTTRKTDHDKVNQFLVQVIDPLMEEAARRFDPTVDDGSIDGTYLDDTATLNLLQSWREMAWRNAERLDAAQTDAERAAVLADIERYSAMVAHLIIAATAYDSTVASASKTQAAALGATLSQLSDVDSARLVNEANGLFGGLFTDARAVRDAHCAANWNS